MAYVDASFVIFGVSDAGPLIFGDLRGFSGVPDAKIPVNGSSVQRYTSATFGSIFATMR
jgi:hypothetical protein